MSLNIVNEVLKEAKKQGIEKAQATLRKTKHYKLNIIINELETIKEYTREELTVTLLNNKKRTERTIGLVGLDIPRWIEEVKLDLDSGEPDEALDFPMEPKWFEYQGDTLTEHKQRLPAYVNDFLKECKEKYKSILISEGNLLYESSELYLANTYGLNRVIKNDFAIIYLVIQPTGRSFDYMEAYVQNINKKLIDDEAVKEILERNNQELPVRKISETFEGDVILAPHIMAWFMFFIKYLASDVPWISKSSPFFDKIEKQVGDRNLNISFKPREVLGSLLINREGCIEEDVKFIENGVLKGALLSYYGSLKTNHPRLGNTGSACIIEPGQKSIKDIVKSVKKGILVGRLSSGSPALNGDFSSIIKNSLLIENGEIVAHISNVSISENILQLIQNIELSKETITHYSGIYPYVYIPKVTFSIG